MIGTLSYFPKLSTAAKKESSDNDKPGLIMNGSKVVFDKEVALIPVMLQTKKEKPDGTNRP